MAIYHLHSKPISRSAGRSAIACAAYRSGEKLYSEETNRTFDYTNKGGVVHSEIALCPNAPERFLDRQTLWNSVQSIENKADSRLARDFDMALPIECSKEEWIAIGREFAAYMTAQGMIADWAIHDPVDKETGLRDNPHIHMMCTTRPIKENGEWGSKEKKVYKLDKNGERIPVIDPETGEQKIGAKGRKMWQRETVESTGWNSKEKLVEWREQWAVTVNKHIDLHKEQHPEQEINHIDHRSFKDQGIDLIPTIHEGYVAKKIDKELQAEDPTQHAELVQKNIQIREQNRLIQMLNEIRYRITEKARALYDRIRELTGNGKLDRSVGAELAIAGTGEQGLEGISREIERRERETPSILERARARVTALKEKSNSKDLSNTDMEEGTQEVRHNAGSEQLAGLIKRRTERASGISTGSSRSAGSDAVGAGKSTLEELRSRARAAERAREKREAEQLRTPLEESREIKPKRSRGQDLSL